MDVTHSTACVRNTGLWNSWHKKITALWKPPVSCGQLAKAYQKRGNEKKGTSKGGVTDVTICQVGK